MDLDEKNLSREINLHGEFQDKLTCAFRRSAPAKKSAVEIDKSREGYVFGDIFLVRGF